MFCKGTIVAVRQCSGCVEVTVTGKSPGAFVIDNCCVWPIVDAEGTNWIGRQVEYADGQMRFRDSQEAKEIEAHSHHNII